MALTEDAIAIVASNLTIAHCTLGKGFPPKSGDETRKMVVEVFERYLRDVRAGQTTHPANPPG